MGPWAFYQSVSLGLTGVDCGGFCLRLVLGMPVDIFHVVRDLYGEEQRYGKDGTNLGF